MVRVSLRNPSGDWVSVWNGEAHYLSESRIFTPEIQVHNSSSPMCVLQNVFLSHSVKTHKKTNQLHSANGHEKANQCHSTDVESRHAGAFLDMTAVLIFVVLSQYRPLKFILNHISRNLLCPYLICQLWDRLEISHRAMQWHCRALCKISKRSDNWHVCYGSMIFGDIWTKTSFGPSYITTAPVLHVTLLS